MSKPLMGTIAWRLEQVEKQVANLDGKVDRLSLAIVGAALTVSVSMFAAIVTLVLTA